MMVEIGQKVRFDPLACTSGMGSEVVKGNHVTGTVVMVNEPHKWFSVEYGNPKQRISYKFCDIGTDVKLVVSKKKARDYYG